MFRLFVFCLALSTGTATDDNYVISPGALFVRQGKMQQPRNKWVVIFQYDMQSLSKQVNDLNTLFVELSSEHSTLERILKINKDQYKEATQVRNRLNDVWSEISLLYDNPLPRKNHLTNKPRERRWIQFADIGLMSLVSFAAQFSYSYVSTDKIKDIAEKNSNLVAEGAVLIKDQLLIIGAIQSNTMLATNISVQNCNDKIINACPEPEYKIITE